MTDTESFILEEPTEAEVAEAMERHKRLFNEYIHKTEAELNEVFNLGFFNEIAKGYLTLTLQEQGKTREEIRAAQRTLETLFDEVGAEDARRAYRNS